MLIEASPSDLVAFQRSPGRGFAWNRAFHPREDTFPLSLFMYGGMENDLVREKIFRDDEKEGGQCPIREGFMVCIMIMYDTMGLQMSRMRREELVGKIPEFARMHEVRTYNDDDRMKALAEMK